MNSVLDVGVHGCCRFTSDEERAAVVAVFIEEGLRRGERVAVYTRTDAPPVLDRLDVDLDEMRELGQLVTGDVEAAYLSGGAFDGRARAAEFAAFAGDTVAAGFPALRVYADNGGIPALLDDPREWLTYEARVATTVPRFALTGLCGFQHDDPPLLSPRILDAFHERNLSVGPRPLTFHLRGQRDGTLVLSGEADVLALAELQELLTAVRPVLPQHPLSLAGLSFVDIESAYELHQFSLDVGDLVRDVPDQVRQVWKLLGLHA